MPTVNSQHAPAIHVLRKRLSTTCWTMLPSNKCSCSMVVVVWRWMGWGGKVVLRGQW